MNATPQCYDYEVGSPGWSFFYDTEALPDDRLGIAQLSNRLLVPPDALPFEGETRGEFFGYTYMALPFTAPVPAEDGRAPTGDQAWTCFVSTANFKGPIAYYIPETWSKIGDLFDYEFIHGRGLDARSGRMGGGAMEINTVPQIVASDAAGNRYSKIPKLSFPSMPRAAPSWCRMSPTTRKPHSTTTSSPGAKGVRHRPGPSSARVLSWRS